MNITDEKKLTIVNCLEELDCCSRCILRFLGVKVYKNENVYVEPENYFNKIGLSTSTLSVPTKKLKRNPCRVCLDVLSRETIEEYVENISKTNEKEYQYEDFVIYISFPKTISIRNRSTFVYLKEKYPDIYKTLEEVETVKKTFRTVSNDIISKRLDKIFRESSKFQLLFEINYEDDLLEVKQISHLKSQTKKREVISRNIIEEVLENCSDELFKRYFPVPSELPSKKTTCEIKCSAERLFLGGRYLKFSRDMGQTPFIVNNKLICENSVQDIIFDSIENLLGFDKKTLTFSASGREDSDVRMLGTGRPFYIQIENPKYENVTFEMCRAVEDSILTSKLVAVLKLQKLDSRNSLKKIKEGEQNKKKTYLALCQTEAPDVEAVIKIVNDFGSKCFEIDQKTPMRVMHRRTLSSRKKIIHSMVAEAVPGYKNMIQVQVVTQAGTYVKEFVNGDFKRTQPSLSYIINNVIDIVALDVTDVNLLWPEDDEKEIDQS